jgi:hypothetical protein
MRRVLFSAVLFLVVVFSHTACRKSCFKCELTGGVSKTYPLACGNNERDMIEIECLNDAMEQNNAGNLTNCSCLEQ